MRFILPCLFASIILFTLSACATGRTMVNHKFSFDTGYDSPGIAVLDYQYGSSGQFATYANKEKVARGMPFMQQSIHGLMPLGEFLYVKWRIINTGQVFEDKVDLISRFPDDIDNVDFDLHFVPKGSQLYVFLEYPWDGKPWQQEPLRNRYAPVSGGVKRYEGSKILQIYPDQPKQ
jgi:hypothetical protein